MQLRRWTDDQLVWAAASFPCPHFLGFIIRRKKALNLVFSPHYVHALIPYWWWLSPLMRHLFSLSAQFWWRSSMDSSVVFKPNFWVILWVQIHQLRVNSKCWRVILNDRSVGGGPSCNYLLLMSGNKHLGWEIDRWSMQFLWWYQCNSALNNTLIMSVHKRLEKFLWALSF